LGNQKPEILARVEKEIWKVLWTISEDSQLAVVVKALGTFMSSDAFVEALALPPSDPAFSFFHRELVLFPVNVSFKTD
jgi:hypothetical protein